MIVWGGNAGGYTNTGGSYDPATDSWTATTVTGAPTSRGQHTAAWTGSRMIIWGGNAGGYTNTGGVYDPQTDSWTPTATTAAPTPRGAHTAVWTGSQMIVWGGSAGGYTNTGGIYFDPSLLPPPTAFHSVTPCRVADTRNPPGPSGGPALGANTTRSFPVTGLCGVPPTATGVAIKVTVVNETDYGNLRLYPAGGALPGSSTINFTVNRVRANNAVIPLGTSGEIGVRCDMPPGSTGQTDFLFDVTGYFE